ncbi:hypothetical protein U879_00570 [Defluviimonas sp. 20V17]|uniref:Uncharacterized alpha/beta hydrolase domain n=1 Tax=Allgaiera indica TaxID=765699 RepID=A0AAN4UTG3_9RHOB|nr:DUF2235 domain-containing protein [Allgaiera indica]KDB05619.1 hypothetical protein U879_00570 [Defluviimonas sp. 20V17]GHE04359.1 hypothetical protein GCM10008024_31290 [Allgaiera indica]SDX40448.1 Uncharacterized alpha/beta hydrolase domain [Allgaiera indica]
MSLAKRLLGWIWPGRRYASQAPGLRRRGPVDHVVILDGTLSTLDEGRETNAGLAYKLLAERTPSPHLSLYYEAGIQWQSWRQSADVIAGRGINRQIRRAYGFLASRYRPGDRIFLMGYSRGAYAVRSLAGVIDRVGLLRAEHANVRNIRTAYRHYQMPVSHETAAAFAQRFCHKDVKIEMIGVWDTVKALGWRLPILHRFSAPRHAFHNHDLGPAILRGFHALALDETRLAFAPVLWNTPEAWPGRVEQVWFRGTHGDVGGMLGEFEAARPLANIPLVWMLEQGEALGLTLPEGWRQRFAIDPDAPMVGTWSGWGKMFLLRQRRVVGQDASERIHPTAKDWHSRTFQSRRRWRVVRRTDQVL